MSDSFLSLFEHFNSSDSFLTEESQDNIMINEFSIDNTNKIKNNSYHELIIDHIDSFSFFNEQNNFAEEKLNEFNLNLSILSTNYNTKNSFIIHKKRKKHDKFALDNIKRKILNHYFIFLTNIINTIISFIFNKEENKQKIQFLTIKYDFRNIKFNKKIFNSLRNEKTIKDVFLNYPNNKNKNSKKRNEEIMHYIINKNNNIINNILAKLCFEFINIYYNNERKINLSKYGLNVTIYLQKIKLFQDLLNANKSNDKKENQIYSENMEKCIQEYYIRKAPYFRVK